MRYYLIENMMGFESPVEEGNSENMVLRKKQCDRNPATRRIGTGPDAWEIHATYYIVPKKDWDLHNCPLIPVDLS